MASPREVVVTGLGLATPLGMSRETVWQSLVERRAGIFPLARFNREPFPVRMGGQVRDFDAKLYVTPRKSLKVMSREIQLGFAAAALALEDAGVAERQIDADRFGVVFGADMMYFEGTEVDAAFLRCMDDEKFDFRRWGEVGMQEMYPLWLLKYLPNMPACHVAIAHDARGPNNTILLGEVSSLLALSEGMRTIEMDRADLMIVGGTSCAIHARNWVFRDPAQFSRRYEEPDRAVRPFDAERDGEVPGEGAAAFVLESRQHAAARGARPLARVVSYASTFGCPCAGAPDVNSIRNSIRVAIEKAGITASEIDHVNANGSGSPQGDRAEAQAIVELLGDVPVTAPKSFFGSPMAATGALETAVSLLAFQNGLIPVTLNHERRDPDCPVNVIAGEPRPTARPYALLLNQAPTGQCVAVVLGREPAA
jgi:3-oxoacyl-[acyl-carrier-protein] synthase II